MASIYIATIVGAGYASGREITEFFTSYYSGGFYGILLTGVLFSFIGYTVLNKVYSERIQNYEEFLFPTVGWGFRMGYGNNRNPFYGICFFALWYQVLQV